VTLDELAQVAARDLASATGRGLDPEAMLARLHRARRRRTAVASVAAAAVLAAAAAGVGAVVGPDGAAPSPRPPAVSLPDRTTEPTDDPCDQPLVSCSSGGATVRVALRDPVVLSAPPDFELYPTVFSVDALDMYRNDVTLGTGVSVVEHVIPVRNGSDWVRDPAAGDTARTVATWLAHRPFLQPTSAVRVLVGTRTGWRVRTVLRPGADLRAVNGAAPVAPLFRTSTGARAFVGPALPGEMTVLGSPHGHGVLLVWSWTTTGRTAVLAGNRAMVATVRFP